MILSLIQHHSIHAAAFADPGDMLARTRQRAGMPTSQASASATSEPVRQATQIQVTTIEPTPVVSVDSDGRTGPFDIDAASVDVLDQIDGGGQIGRATARQRPY